MQQEKIDRINTLYHKARAGGPTESEKKEQASLRREYVEAIRMSLKGKLDSILIQEEDGAVTDLGKKYGNIK